MENTSTWETNGFNSPANISKSNGGNGENTNSSPQIPQLKKQSRRDFIKKSAVLMVWGFLASLKGSTPTTQLEQKKQDDLVDTQDGFTDVERNKIEASLTLEVTPHQSRIIPQTLEEIIALRKRLLDLERKGSPSICYWAKVRNLNEQDLKSLSDKGSIRSSDSYRIVELLEIQDQKGEPRQYSLVLRRFNIGDGKEYYYQLLDPIKIDDGKQTRKVVESTPFDISPTQIELLWAMNGRAPNTFDEGTPPFAEYSAIKFMLLPITHYKTDVSSPTGRVTTSSFQDCDSSEICPMGETISRPTARAYYEYLRSIFNNRKKGDPILPSPVQQDRICTPVAFYDVNKGRFVYGLREQIHDISLKNKT